MIKRIALTAIAVVAVLYIVVLVLLYFNQRTLFYAPDGRLWEITETSVPAQAVTIPTEDDGALGGWFGPPRDGAPTIIYFKGNSGSFSSEHERFDAFSQAGYGFLAFDYRGFPASPGTITQDGILADALAAFDWLAEEVDGPILIWGRSLGASPATYVASQREAAALLLETPFYSAVGVAAERYPYVPVSLLMLDQFPSNEWIVDVEEPVFVAHGTADRTISVSNAERLYEIAPNPVDIWIEEGAGHSDLWTRGIWARAQAFFEDALGQ